MMAVVRSGYCVRRTTCLAQNVLKVMNVGQVEPVWLPIVARKFLREFGGEMDCAIGF
jgi:hypothetical protein